MKRLATTFFKLGWYFEQIKRNDQAAIYRRTNLQTPEVIYFETIKIISQDEKTARIAGKDVTFDSQEHYPTNEQFGLMGKCCMTIGKATEFYTEFTHGETIGRLFTSETTYPLNRGKKCEILNTQI